MQGKGSFLLPCSKMPISISRFVHGMGATPQPSHSRLLSPALARLGTLLACRLPPLSASWVEKRRAKRATGTCCTCFQIRTSHRLRCAGSIRGGAFKKKNQSTRDWFLFGGATRNRTGDEGFADLCLTAWLWRHSCSEGEGDSFSFRIIFKSNRFGAFVLNENGHDISCPCYGADYGARTRHLHLGKVALYQMS